MYLEPEQITNDVLQHAEILIVRTRTRCDRFLLRNTPVRFIGTATIGTDHIDIDYCRSQHITVCNAPGCNARGVAQYIESALLQLDVCKGKTIGIIGVGHVGSLVQQMAQRHGLRTLLYDPPRQRAEGGLQWTDKLSTIAEKADIITFHTPLTKKGEDKTFHIADSDFFSQCKPTAVIINAARGGIIDETALLGHASPEMKIVIDTWENEPHINPGLLQRADIATPHIAGYSDEGKRNATRMIINQLANYLHTTIDTSGLLTDSTPLPTYDIMQDDRNFRLQPQAFDFLREHYLFR